MTTPAAVEAAFRARVLGLACSACGIAYTDAAVDWGHAWREGRDDLLSQHGWAERDGPFKLRCEYCGARAWLDYFGWTVRPATAVGG